MARSQSAPLALLALLVVAGACSSPKAAAWNLRELHNLDGSTRLVGRVQSHGEFALRQALTVLPFARNASGLGPADKPARPIRRPLDRTLEELLILASFDGSEPAVGGLQVELFAWLAKDDPYVLARERCVIELGRAGQRLGVQRVLQGPPEGDGATAEQVGQRVAEVLAAVDQGGPADLDRALAEAVALPLDLEGSRRVLAALNRAGERNLNGAARQKVESASLDLARRTVALALGAALMDPEGVVRAAALRAAARLGEESRRDVLRAWGKADQASFDADPHVLYAVAQLLEAGVPEGDDLEPWLDRLYVIAEHPFGPASVAACRTFSAWMPDEPASLRPEDWLMRLLALDQSRGDGAQP